MSVHQGSYCHHLLIAVSKNSLSLAHVFVNSDDVFDDLFQDFGAKRPDGGNSTNQSSGNNANDCSTHDGSSERQLMMFSELKRSDEELLKALAASSGGGEQRKPTATSWSRFSLRNKELQEGEWVQEIIWDRPSRPAYLITNHVIIDLNDTNMLFDLEYIRAVSELPDPLLKVATGQSDDEQDAAEDDGGEDTENQEQPQQQQPQLGNLDGGGEDDELNDDDVPKSASIDASNLESANGVLRLPPSMKPKHPAPPEVDARVNLSIDHLYVNTRAQEFKRPKLGMLALQHAAPAQKLSLVKTHLTPEDLREFHRPRAAFHPGSSMRLAIPGRERPSKNPSPYIATRPGDAFKRRRDLSSRTGQLLAVESIEEEAPIILNIGMACKLINYTRRAANGDTTTAQVWREGEDHLLEPTDESPFLGGVLPGQTVRSFDNNLYRVPVVKHEAARTDFLLVRSRDGKRFFVREMPAALVAGQQQPLKEVPAPNSRTTLNFVKNRLQAYIYRQFKSKSNKQLRLRMTDVCAAFPSQSETSIRKRLKDCADFQRGGDDSGSWVLNESFQLPKEEDIRAMVTPETVCLYESMMAGQQRLIDKGIHVLRSHQGIQTVLAHSPHLSAVMKRDIQFLKRELTLTPWNSTANFVAATQGKGMLQLTGYGDPLGHGNMFSYVRLPQKATQQKRKQQNVPKATVTGTDADLRKLSLDNARLVLLKFGVSEEEIQKLTRWHRIDLVRKLSSQAAVTGDSNAVTKFARGSRASMQQMIQNYNQRCQAIFTRQLRLLSTTADLGEFDSDESDEERAAAELNDEAELNALELEEEVAAAAAAAGETGGPAAVQRLFLQQQQLRRMQLEQEQQQAKAAAAAAGTTGTSLRGGGVMSQRAPPPPPPPPPSLPLAPVVKSKEEQYARVRPSVSFDDGKRKYLRKTTTTRNSDGTFTKKIEIIRAPNEVQDFIRQQKRMLNNGSGSKSITDILFRRLRLPMSAAEEKQQANERKIKRRQQEQLRRQKNRERSMAAANAAAAQGDGGAYVPPTSLSRKEQNVRCSRIREVGWLVGWLQFVRTYERMMDVDQRARHDAYAGGCVDALWCLWTNWSHAYQSLLSQVW